LHKEFLSYCEVEHLTGLSRTTIWREVKAKRFPVPVSISPNRVGFRASVVQDWLAARKPKTAA
jgi:prophage regulatory protein